MRGRWGPLLQMVAGVLAALVIAEGFLQVTGDGSVAKLDVYALGGGAGITLQAEAEVLGRMPAGQRYRARTDGRGLRLPAPAAPEWLLIGDSLPFGLGVEDEETAAARLLAAGISAASGGVPAFGIADALAHAEALAPPGVVVLPNAIDDDRQGSRRLVEDNTVIRGRLIRRAAPAWVRRVYGSPLVAWRLPATLMRLVSLLYNPPTLQPRPGWVVDDDGGLAAFQHVGEAIAAFAERHPDAAVRVAWVPLPVVAAPDRAHPSAYGRVAQGGGERWSDARAREGLRAGLAGAGVPLLDLSEDFAGRAEAYLDGDTHLSAEGNALLAARLADWL